MFKKILKVKSQKMLKAKKCYRLKKLKLKNDKGR